MGEHDIRTENLAREDVFIARVNKHPQYNRTLMIYDVAVITLKRDLIFNGAFNIQRFD